MNKYTIAILISMGIIATQGLAKEAPFNVYIKNSSPRNIWVHIIDKFGDKLTNRQTNLQGFKISPAEKGKPLPKPLQDTYDIDAISQIKIEYAKRDNPTGGSDLAKYRVDIDTQGRKFDKIFVKFKIDEKGDRDIPSLQPQEGVFSLSGRVTDDKDKYSLTGNIKKDDMTPVRN